MILFRKYMHSVLITHWFFYYHYANSSLIVHRSKNVLHMCFLLLFCAAINTCVKNLIFSKFKYHSHYRSCMLQAFFFLAGRCTFGFIYHNQVYIISYVCNNFFMDVNEVCICELRLTKCVWERWPPPKWIKGCCLYMCRYMLKSKCSFVCDHKTLTSLINLTKVNKQMQVAPTHCLETLAYRCFRKSNFIKSMMYHILIL